MQIDGQKFRQFHLSRMLGLHVPTYSKLHVLVCASRTECTYTGPTYVKLVGCTSLFYGTGLVVVIKNKNYKNNSMV